MRNRVVFLVMLLLSLMLVFPAAAQDSTVFCGNLAAADCELLTANAEAQKTLTSASIAISGELNIVGIPDTPDMSIKLDGSSAYSIDPAVLESLNAMGESGSTPEMSALIDALLEYLKGIDAELTLNVNLPAELSQQMGLPVNTVTLDAKLVDGIGYLNFDELDKVAGGMLAQQGMQGWMGINFAEVGEQFVQQNAAMIEQMGAMAGSTTMMANAADYEFVMQYLTIARTDAGSGDAEFTTGVDIAGLMADPQFQELMKQQMAAQGNSMTDEQFQQMMPMMTMMTQGLDMNVVQRINADSKQTTHVGVNFNFDLSSMMAMMGEAGSGQTEVGFTLNFDYTGHNATSVSAPAGAQVAPSEMILQMLSGGAGR
jgi:hypothetical protein